jgi:hypothetical protein
MRAVFIDPDGTCHSYLGVIVAHPTGVSYFQQCGGVDTIERSLEGFFVPLGGTSFDPEQGHLDSVGLTAVFHDQGCQFGGASRDGKPQLPPERIEELRLLVEAIPYWVTSATGDSDRRDHLRLDDSRLADLVEAWIPVITPDGPGILTWPNCD